MSAPRYRYLTKSYVQWLGLPETWVQRLNGIACWVPENGRKPLSMTPFERGVKFEGNIYIKTDDGLAYDLA